MKASLEEQIFQSEATYLEETAAGNIIKGFDNYIKGSGTTSGGMGTAGSGTSTRRKGTITEHDRVFSRSSASFTRVRHPMVQSCASILKDFIGELATIQHVHHAFTCANTYGYSIHARKQSPDANKYNQP